MIGKSGVTKTNIWRARDIQNHERDICHFLNRIPAQNLNQLTEVVSFNILVIFTADDSDRTRV